MFQCKIILH